MIEIIGKVYLKNTQTIRRKLFILAFIGLLRSNHLGCHAALLSLWGCVTSVTTQKTAVKHLRFSLMQRCSSFDIIFKASVDEYLRLFLVVLSRTACLPCTNSTACTLFLSLLSCLLLFFFWLQTFHLELFPSRKRASEQLRSVSCCARYLRGAY